jgi:hypothetical protein
MPKMPQVKAAGKRTKHTTTATGRAIINRLSLANAFMV